MATPHYQMDALCEAMWGGGGERGGGAEWVQKGKKDITLVSIMKTILKQKKNRFTVALNNIACNMVSNKRHMDCRNMANKYCIHSSCTHKERRRLRTWIYRRRPRCSLGRRHWRRRRRPVLNKDPFGRNKRLGLFPHFVRYVWSAEVFQFQFFKFQISVFRIYFHSKTLSLKNFTTATQFSTSTLFLSFFRKTFPIILFLKIFLSYILYFIFYIFNNNFAIIYAII